MASSEAAAQSDGSLFSLPELYQQIRSVTVSLCQHLYPDARWQFLGIRLAKDGGA